jgi:DNA-binding CsgD family transcriptional regulator
MPKQRETDPIAWSAASLEAEAARLKLALHEARSELAVLLAVIRTLPAWKCFEHGSELLLRELAGALGQTAAALWLPHRGALVTRAIWSSPSIDHDTLERGLSGRRVPRGVGLAGLAWERREAINGTIARSNNRLSRVDERPAGLSARIAFPCWEGEEVLAVVETYCTEQDDLGGHLMQALGYAGRGCGAFFAHRRGELGLSPLSLREVQVLELAGEGLGVREIGLRLTISDATVKTHLEHIYRKLGVRDRAAAVAHALRAGIIE